MNANITKTKQTSLVCRSCREKGYYPENVQTYTCQRCKQQLGGKKFDSLMLRHFEHDHQPKLVCKECTSREANQLKELQTKLKMSQRRCNCHRPLHDPRCPLGSFYHGERRWPGSDGYITIQERICFDNLNPNPPWWRAAWGRSTK